ncbi:anti-sigma factor RsiW [Mesorhizobium soli]|jgi:anti-sigma factor RsiW|uniref:anti-sigma factor family protein n=1 Tax=Pseudaminobacter soli (ex Li et al. 2025) TaxID=1295366 RepID=UPI002474F726|nr:anti-sigma factor [Mesorhizobium soli]MDH6230376.1 anti-sigma factor RsiW [Mesorhizobium soli]
MSEENALPTNGTDLRLLLHALADGELDAATTLSVERRLAGDPALAAEYARILALRTAIGGLPRPDVSDAFRARIAALADGEKATGRPTEHRLGSFDWRAMAASILVTAAVASGATYWATSRIAQSSFVGEIASAQQRSLLAASPVDVASSDRHTVKPWLDARIGMSPPTVDLSKDGYVLLGGRVDVIENRPVPALVYQLRKHLITLIAAPRESGSEPVPVAKDLSTGGFSLIHWTEGAFSYWAISDISASELQEFVTRFRAAAAAG